MKHGLFTTIELDEEIEYPIISLITEEQHLFLKEHKHVFKDTTVDSYEFYVEGSAFGFSLSGDEIYSMIEKIRSVTKNDSETFTKFGIDCFGYDLLEEVLTIITGEL